jgi:chromosome segregation ATPase
MKLTADRYNRLAQAYLTLSEEFQQLDVEHMRLKHKLVPLLKALQSYQRISLQWKQKKAELEEQLQSLEAENEILKVSLEMAKAQESELTAALLTANEQQGTLVEALQRLQAQKEELEMTVLNLSADKSELAGKLTALESQWEPLKPLAALLEPESQAMLKEAEDQMALVAETLQEMATDSDPDLLESDKQLLAEYDAQPEKFALLSVELGERNPEDTLSQDTSQDLSLMSIELPQSA